MYILGVPLRIKGFQICVFYNTYGQLLPSLRASDAIFFVINFCCLKDVRIECTLGEKGIKNVCLHFGGFRGSFCGLYVVV